LLVAVDLRGQWQDPYPFWNASTEAPAERLRADLDLLPRLAEAGRVAGLGLPAHTGPVCLLVGGVEQRKNTPRLLHAFARLRRSEAAWADARLVVAGGASLRFAPQLGATIDQADRIYNGINAAIDRPIAEKGLDAPAGGVYEPVWAPAQERETLSLAGSGISSTRRCSPAAGTRCTSAA